MTTINNIIHGNSVDVISSEINKFIDAKETRSLRSLELTTNVSRNYIKRLSSKLISEEKMDIFKVYSILKVSVGRIKAKKIILSNSTLKRKFLTLIDSSEKNAENISLQFNLDGVLSNKDQAIVFTLGINECGTNVEQIMAVLGERGVIALKKLLKSNLLIMTEQGKIFIHPEVSEGDQNVILAYSKESCKKMVPFWLDFYDPYRSGVKKSHLTAITQSVNDLFLEKAAKKLTEMKIWFDEEVNKKEHRGNSPAFIALCMDTFIKNLESNTSLKKRIKS